MNKIMGIILTLSAGLFFLVGYLITKRVKNKEKLNNFSVALAFMVMIGLIFTHLLGEAIELLEGEKLISKIILIGLFSLSGFILLKLLDLFIPSHSHEHKEKYDNKKEHISHVKHIGTITIISLILHNILEGMAIFSMSDIDLKIGLLMSISIALHNIPLGTQIFSSINIKENKLAVSCLVFSSFIGGLISLMIGQVSNLVLSIISSITMGMLIYITFWELLKDTIHKLKQKEVIGGLLVGLGVIVISLFV